MTDKTAIAATFKEIYLLMLGNAKVITENYQTFLHYEMETYTLIYEVEGLRLIQLFKKPFRSLNGGKITTITNKVLARSTIEKNSHKLAILECSEIDLQNIHLELKFNIEKISN